MRLSGADYKKAVTPVAAGWSLLFQRFVDWRHLGRAPEELDHFVSGLPAPLRDENALAVSEVPRGRRLEQRLRPEVIEDVVSEYQGGATCRELARKYNVSVSGMEALLKRRGVTLRGAYKRLMLTSEQKTEIVTLYRDGARSHPLGAKFGVSSSTVMKLVREAGVRVHGTWPDAATLAAAEERYGEGRTVEQVATELGFTKTTMLRAMKEAGIQLRRKGRRSIWLGSEQ